MHEIGTENVIYFYSTHLIKELCNKCHLNCARMLFSLRNFALFFSYNSFVEIVNTHEPNGDVNTTEWGVRGFLVAVEIFAVLVRQNAVLCQRLIFILSLYHQYTFAVNFLFHSKLIWHLFLDSVFFFVYLVVWINFAHTKKHSLFYRSLKLNWKRFSVTDHTISNELFGKLTREIIFLCSFLFFLLFFIGNKTETFDQLLNENQRKKKHIRQKLCRIVPRF